MAQLALERAASSRSILCSHRSAGSLSQTWPHFLSLLLQSDYLPKSLLPDDLPAVWRLSRSCRASQDADSVPDVCAPFSVQVAHSKSSCQPSLQPPFLRPCWFQGVICWHSGSQQLIQRQDRELPLDPTPMPKQKSDMSGEENIKIPACQGKIMLAYPPSSC